MTRATRQIPANRPDEAILAFVRELAKRAAREDHEAEIAARLNPTPAIIRKS